MLSRIEVTFIITIIILIGHGFAFEIEPSGDPNEKYNGESNDYHVFAINENNKGGSINLAFLNNVNGDLIINDYDDKTLNLRLNMSDDGRTYIEIDLVDYEKVKSQYLYELADDVNTAPGLSLTIVNLDDESPTFSTVTCKMKENTTINTDNSECIFTVSDPDGFLSTMDFSEIIDNGKGEDKLFKLVYKDNPPDTAAQSSVYLVLQDGEILDYETTALYTFNVKAKDAAGHATVPHDSVQIIVQVEDIPDNPPVWQTFSSSKKILEKTKETIEISAKDGDYGIANTINYRITTDLKSITIDKDTGVITIDGINRDGPDGKDTVIIEVTAYEVGDEESTLTDTITLMIEDIDDQIPEISIPYSDAKEIIKEIPENSNTLDIALTVTDLDLGDNAMYTAELIEVNSPEYLTAFEVIPGRGYETTSLSINIKDPKKLDYEDENWRSITFAVFTKGTKNSGNNCTFPITLTLSDLNDEPPVFSQDVYNVNVLENCTINGFVATIQATDKDAADAGGVKHEILGTMAQNILQIPELGGDVTAKEDKAFDYEKQNEIIVQIRATDLNNNSATTQLIINVIDIDDEPPRLIVSSTIEIPENQPDGTVLQTQIEASDEDKGANLKFDIDWGQSSATKNSVKLDKDEFEKIKGCIKVETIQGETNQEATAKLSIVEINRNNTPDYEVFDTLSLKLIVEDTATELNSGTDSATIVINIKNDNDNFPEFIEGTETTRRYVTQNAKTGTIIGVVTATDKDNLASLNYTIKSANSNTPNWVGIKDESGSGSLFVNLEGDDTVDCDKPNERDSITYTVTASDGKHLTSIDITIDIIDQNDKSPKVDGVSVEWNEDNEITGSTQTGAIILNFNDKIEDDDRDEPYHTVKCSFQPDIDPNVSSRFKIENNSIIVTGDATLNREEIPSFTFQLQCMDDPTHTGPIPNYASPPPSFTITLKDVNDKIPKITTTDVKPPLSENTAKGFNEIKIEAVDEDDQENGEISFEITNILHISSNGDKTNLDLGFFSLTPDESKKNGILQLNGDLTGYYGQIQLTINTTDGGTPPLFYPDNLVNIEVTKFNFREPKFIFPVDGEIYYLNPTQTSNSKLKLYNGDDLDNLLATDQQKEKYNIKFSIASDTSNGKIFKISNKNNSEAELQIKTDQFSIDGISEITITATLDTDGSPSTDEAPYSKNCTIRTQFFDLNSDPIFDYHQDSTAIKENDATGSYKLPKAAEYPKVNGLNVSIYYLLGNGDEEIFKVDLNTGEVTLNKELDFETNPSYTIVVQSSNSKTLKPDAISDTKLTVTINVTDINDLPPVFDFPDYFGTVLADTSNVDVKKVRATDRDTTSQGKLTYTITKVNASDESLSKIPNPFHVDNEGLIKSQFAATQSMKGFFTVIVQVQDEAPENHTATTQVKIYIVTQRHTVPFKFQNDLDTVKNKADDIKILLDAFFHLESNIETATTETVEQYGSVSVTPVYFINTTVNEPVYNTTIYSQVTNVDTFTKLKSNFTNIGLVLLNFKSEGDSNEDISEILKASLIGVSVVLGSLCIALLVAFILKTRALNKRIKNLSNTKFGSHESGLNRIGVNAPTTNEHSIEGSNPVFNNNTEVDTKDMDSFSVTSGDSDLIGVEDDEKFDYSNKEEVFD